MRTPPPEGEDRAQPRASKPVCLPALKNTCRLDCCGAVGVVDDDDEGSEDNEEEGLIPSLGGGGRGSTHERREVSAREMLEKNSGGGAAASPTPRGGGARWPGGEPGGGGGGGAPVAGTGGGSGGMGAPSLGAWVVWAGGGVSGGTPHSSAARCALTPSSALVHARRRGGYASPTGGTRGQTPRAMQSSSNATGCSGGGRASEAGRARPSHAHRALPPPATFAQSGHVCPGPRCGYTGGQFATAAPQRSCPGVAGPRGGSSCTPWSGVGPWHGGGSLLGARSPVLQPMSSRAVWH